MREDSLMAEDGAATKPVSLWRCTDYGQWLVADTCTSLSNSIQDFSLPIIAQSITGSPALATLIDSVIGFVRGALELPGGLLQDSVDRRRLMTIFGATGFVIFLTAAACAHVGVLGYAALVRCRCAVGHPRRPAWGTSNTMLRGIVPDELLPKAMGLNSGRDAATDLAGAPIGGAHELVGVGRGAGRICDCLPRRAACTRRHRGWPSTCSWPWGRWARRLPVKLLCVWRFWPCPYLPSRQATLWSAASRRCWLTRGIWGRPLPAWVSLVWPSALWSAHWPDSVVNGSVARRPRSFSLLRLQCWRCRH